MAYGGQRDVTASKCSNSKTEIRIERPGLARVYTPSDTWLVMIQELLQAAIDSGSYDVKLDIFDNSLWISVLGL